ncbi:hypothetical protein [Streptomyces sp. V3I7]|uniref:hypothetical protein n=1 Tax=Streptomyces sp. V3I7 TaxID=3042278 RepID=UPI00277F197E|nr:hypothetical protein [Streptomyces sp. V3I7]MDQ0994809.1 hypothetical protein [Streptomyces sp. V3I7]
MSTTIEDVRAFISQLPTPADLAQVQEAAARRLGELDKAAYNDVVPGRRARINDRLNPAVLRRLTGTVQERNRTGSRAGFVLDEDSTRLLRTDPRNRYRIPEDTRRFRIPGNGIPVACLDLIED